jgi:hypothetical protein
MTISFDETWRHNPTDLRDILGIFNGQINDMVVKARRTPEQIFADLDIQPGDRIRLTRKPSSRGGYVAPTATDASTLEGVVLKVKRKGGKWKVQIAGFDVAGNGIFWNVADYAVEVLHRAYRWTDEDRAIAAIAGHSAVTWERQSEAVRESMRQSFGPRLARVKLALGLEGQQDGVE